MSPLLVLPIAASALIALGYTALTIHYVHEADSLRRRQDVEIRHEQTPPPPPAVQAESHEAAPPSISNAK